MGESGRSDSDDSTTSAEDDMDSKETRSTASPGRAVAALATAISTGCVLNVASVLTAESDGSRYQYTCCDCIF